MLGVLLWALTWLINRQLGIRAPGITDPMQLAEPPDLSAERAPTAKIEISQTFTFGEARLTVRRMLAPRQCRSRSARSNSDRFRSG